MYNSQLDTFIQVAESGSFSKAAQVLFVSPTAVIKQMNLLEARLGFALFNRSHQGLTLTEAGKSLLKDARHVVQYSQESIQRARLAERKEKRIIRIGVSLMTPATYFTDLWPHIKESCPDLTLQIVSFENTPQNSRDILRNLGRDIDVVLGIFDEAFLVNNGCLGLELAREPLYCAIPLNNPLASAESISLEDLRGSSLMIIKQGWNKDIDCLRARIAQDYPDIEIVNFSQFRASAFNQCVNDDMTICALRLWRDVHPLLKIVPTDWNCSVSYGLLYSSTPDERVTELIRSLASLNNPLANRLK